MRSCNQDAPAGAEEGPLGGIRVVDLTRILAGPFATMMLGDLGAEVIKVERPGHGDETRRWGPPFHHGVATYYLAVNRNKKSLTLDLKSASGVKILWRLLDGADVLVANFRPGVLDRLGFGYARVAERCPQLIYALINGYGEQGEDASRSSFDLVIQAESGLMDLTGQPGGSPTKVGVSIADEVAGLYLVQGVQAALLARHRSGLGQRVEIALHDAMLSMFTFQAQQYLCEGIPPRRLGNAHPSLVPYRPFQTSDGTVIVGVASDVLWQCFCQAVGLESLLEQDRFGTNAERVGNRAELDALIADRLAENTTAHWINLLRTAKVPCGRIRTLAEALDGTQARSRQMVVACPDSGLRVLGVPLKLSASASRVRRAPPKLGEHTDEILAAVGYSADQIGDLHSRGVV